MFSAQVYTKGIQRSVGIAHSLSGCIYYILIWVHNADRTEVPEPFENTCTLTPLLGRKETVGNRLLTL
jgi:hypothetical protein